LISSFVVLFRLNVDDESSRDVVVLPAMVVSFAAAMNDDFSDGDDDDFSDSGDDDFRCSSKALVMMILVWVVRYIK
jgi:hypothetical protein